jgi:hypothetical protein
MVWMVTGIGRFFTWMVDVMAIAKCNWRNNHGNFLCSTDNLAWANSLEASITAVVSNPLVGRTPLQSAQHQHYFAAS